MATSQRRVLSAVDAGADRCRLKRRRLFCPPSIETDDDDAATLDDDDEDDHWAIMTAYGGTTLGHGAVQYLQWEAVKTSRKTLNTSRRLQDLASINTRRKRTQVALKPNDQFQDDRERLGQLATAWWKTPVGDCQGSRSFKLEIQDLAQDLGSIKTLQGRLKSRSIQDLAQRSLQRRPQHVRDLGQGARPVSSLQDALKSKIQDPLQDVVKFSRFKTSCKHQDSPQAFKTASSPSFQDLGGRLSRVKTPSRSSSHHKNQDTIQDNARIKTPFKISSHSRFASSSGLQDAVKLNISRPRWEIIKKSSTPSRSSRQRKNQGPLQDVFNFKTSRKNQPSTCRQGQNLKTSVARGRLSRIQDAFKIPKTAQEPRPSSSSRFKTSRKCRESTLAPSGFQDLGGRPSRIKSSRRLQDPQDSARLVPLQVFKPRCSGRRIHRDPFKIQDFKTAVKSKTPRFQDLDRTLSRIKIQDPIKILKTAQETRHTSSPSSSRIKTPSSIQDALKSKTSVGDCQQSSSQDARINTCIQPSRSSKRQNRWIIRQTNKDRGGIPLKTPLFLCIPPPPVFRATTCLVFRFVPVVGGPM
ncbi:hypothetical protein DFH09DRAFT_1070025 [Mycena vulgaris]|nr:hypothetical protein DFH09DRAFT_1070025 [Mycena vulgaris]